MENFGRIGDEFINIYSAENAMLDKGEMCYFLLTNNEDYHMPLIAYGEIVDEKFTDGMNKIYFIKLLNFCEVPKIIGDFVNNKPFNTYQFIDGILTNSKRLILAHPDFDFENNVFRIDSFFVRNTEEKAINLRTDYIKSVREDILNMLKDIDTIIT